MRTLPDLAELSFVRAVATGVVHIALSVPSWAETDDPPAMSLGEGLALWAGGAMPTTVLCGRETQPVGSRHEVVACFVDEDLCRGCYRTLPAADQWRAFEHTTPTT